MVKIPGNPFENAGWVVKTDCKTCNFWSDRAGRCTIEPSVPKPCGRPHERPDRADFGKVLG